MLRIRIGAAVRRSLTLIDGYGRDGWQNDWSAVQRARVDARAFIAAIVVEVYRDLTGAARIAARSGADAAVIIRVRKVYCVKEAYAAGSAGKCCVVRDGDRALEQLAADLRLKHADRINDYVVNVKIAAGYGRIADRIIGDRTARLARSACQAVGDLCIAQIDSSVIGIEPINKIDIAVLDVILLKNDGMTARRMRGIIKPRRNGAALAVAGIAAADRSRPCAGIQVPHLYIG